MRSGVCLLVAAVFAVAAAPAGADGTATATGSDTTTSAGATPAATAATAPAYAPVAVAPLSARCAAAGVAAIVLPGHAPLAVGTAPASLGAGTYSAGSPVVSFEAADAAGTSCRPGAVSVRSLSLFGGAVTADVVAASNGRGSVTDLRVGDEPVQLAPGDSVPLEGWGFLVADDQVGKTLSAPLSLHLLEPRAELPAGTVVLIGFGAKPAPAPAVAPPQTDTTSTQAATTSSAASATVAALPDASTGASAKTHRARRHKKKHLPLEVTPPLGLPHYVFPVAHGAGYADTYGGLRSDVKNGWHHGDDLFAPLGTPVLAVASGTLSLLGWNKLGGWRVWLEDAAGNQFYYAHLAAYSHWILDHRTVKAGQVIGFLGRTGDAFTTPPHLHFEIHPRSLLRLKYDGAVDPTTYLQTWKVEWPRTRDLPAPALLWAPKGTPREEADAVWRQLLAKRHVRRTPPDASAPPRHLFPHDDGSRALAGRARAEAVAARRPSGMPVPGADGTLALLLLGGVAAAGTLAAVFVRRAGRPDDAEPALAAAPGPVSPVTPSAPPVARTPAPNAPHAAPTLLVLGGIVGTSAVTALVLRRRAHRD